MSRPRLLLRFPRLSLDTALAHYGDRLPEYRMDAGHFLRQRPLLLYQCVEGPLHGHKVTALLAHLDLHHTMCATVRKQLLSLQLQLLLLPIVPRRWRGADG